MTEDESSEINEAIKTLLEMTDDIIPIPIDEGITLELKKSMKKPGKKKKFATGVMPAMAEPYSPTDNPFNNYEALDKEHQTHKYSGVHEVAQTSRTLVIVHGSVKSDSEFKERARRLIGSLNMGETIKCVVVTISGGDMYMGLDLTHQPGPDSDVVSEENLTALKHRFVQVLDVRDARL